MVGILPEHGDTMRRLVTTLHCKNSYNYRAFGNCTTNSVFILPRNYTHLNPYSHPVHLQNVNFVVFDMYSHLLPKTELQQKLSIGSLHMVGYVAQRSTRSLVGIKGGPVVVSPLKVKNKKCRHSR